MRKISKLVLISALLVLVLSISALAVKNRMLNGNSVMKLTLGVLFMNGHMEKRKAV